MCVDAAYLQFLSQWRGKLPTTRQGSCDDSSLRCLRILAFQRVELWAACSEYDVILVSLRGQFVHLGHAIRLSAVVHLD